MNALVVTLLYAPADRPDLVAKALRSSADVVVLDLEDAVAPAHKAAARDTVRELVAGSTRPVQVRVNATATPWHDEDLTLVSSLRTDVGVRLPKVETSDDVVKVAARLPGRPLHLLIESALGVENAFALATAASTVASVGLGEADLLSDMRCTAEEGLAFARSRIIVAARAAGLPSPTMSVYPHVRDRDGLRDSCLVGRRLGFCGRAAIHPGQLDVIRTAFAPAPDEVAHAQRVIDSVGAAGDAGVGVVLLADGTFLDIAMVEHARFILALVAATADGGGGRQD
ncbi:MAG: CoA ester lyase [Cellulomonas sp.]|uniref:HpcH/HpaI aldolase/citrate lyase family protein n=1 Tax=Cellulomonas sp. 73-92 TaxID=1895740 RepID=UPI000925B56C|nr:CoA ester lyase [Cellulomonas sp. 73-92]MBN9376116.1 CoA ester lyase [Cellulomonas sp.]OJV82976.1 MAG: CoA ester lyase [Cellulomonas sp. 73-92]